ncbi:MAG: hypothetical protein R3C39_14750 [Dehalococcoidia bacterium]
MTTNTDDRIEPTLETVRAGDRFGPVVREVRGDNPPDYFDAAAVDSAWLRLPDGRVALPHSAAFEDGNRTFSTRYLSGRKLNARVRHTFYRPLVPPVRVTDAVEIPRTLIRRGREHVEFLATVHDEDGRLLMASQNDWVMNSSVRHEHDTAPEGVPSVFDLALPPREYTIEVPSAARELRVDDELPSLERAAWLAEPPGGHGPNSVHGDEYARRVLGTRGAIVLGSTVLGYVNEQLGRTLGPAWLERGTLDVRFVGPVVRGDLVTARTRVSAVLETHIEFEVTVSNAAVEDQSAIVGTARFEL